MLLENDTDIVENSLQNCFILTLPAEITDRKLDIMQEKIPEIIVRRNFKGLVIDFSPVQVIDRDEFEQIRKIASAAELLCSASVFVGLRPGIVAALIDLDVDTEGITACRDIEDGVAYLNRYFPDQNYCDDNNDREEQNENPDFNPDDSY